MEPFTIVDGIAASMPAANIDTDVIMPKVFLKGVDRSGLDAGVFYDLRFGALGERRRSFVLNQSAWSNTAFLIVGPNFGCGSSREHAVWGLRQLGIRALIGTSFAGIFFDNCARNGLLALSLDAEQVTALAHLAEDSQTHQLKIDLPEQTIECSAGMLTFQIDRALKTALVRGLDAIGTTLEDHNSICAFEQAYDTRYPWLALNEERG
jgi:3-isopropylmalate/(R)-2-methylmalate dehydratase small subunit